MKVASQIKLRAEQLRAPVPELSKRQEHRAVASGPWRQ